MSTVTPVPVRPDLQPAPGGFGRLLRAEWTKFRTVRGWVIAMIVAALAIDVMGLFAAGQASIGCQSPNGVVRHGRACLPPIPTGPNGAAVSDSYYLVSKPLSGDGSLTVRLTGLTGRYSDNGGGPAPESNPLAGMQPGLQPWSKAGIMITASTRPGAAYAAILASGSHGVALQYDYTGDVAGLPGRPTAAAPRWLRLARSGDTITGWDSADGTHWTRVGTVHLAGLPATVRIGMFATSPPHMDMTEGIGGSTSGSEGSSLATGVFDHATLTGATAQPWVGNNVGGQGNFGSSTSQVETWRQAGGRFTVTGSGDIAPVVLGAASTLPDTTIENHLIGTFAGLIAVAVVAAMFVTAEYRRGLIRTTFAAVPARGRVLAAKSVVMAAVAFVAGVVAAVVAVPIGVRLDRAQGMYVIPVSGLTEARVIVGTGALLAVFAVLAVAIGAITRRGTAGVTLAIVAVMVPFLLGVASLLPGSAGEWMLRLSPAAGFAIQQSVPAYPQVTNFWSATVGYFPLSPWAGLAVTCAWAAAALIAATVLLRRRDT